MCTHHVSYITKYNYCTQYVMHHNTPPPFPVWIQLYHIVYHGYIICNGIQHTVAQSAMGDINVGGSPSISFPLKTSHEVCHVLFNKYFFSPFQWKTSPKWIYTRQLCRQMKTDGVKYCLNCTKHLYPTKQSNIYYLLQL